MCASLAEDRYGVVQRDIPKIVEALLSFLGALEEYQEDLNKKYALPPAEELTGLSAKEVAQKETLAMEAARASEVLGVVSDGELRCMRRLWVGLTLRLGVAPLAIKDGVVLIVRTFGDKLAAFRFPPRIAKKLQGFVDYN